MNDNGVQAWAPPTSEGERHPTYIESIFSMATGQYETAMSIRVKDENDPKKNKVLVLVYPFSTVNNIYLESNYQFAVINQSGMIQYHSNASKINNENLKEHFKEVMIYSTLNHPNIVSYYESFIKN